MDKSWTAEALVTVVVCYLYGLLAGGIFLILSVAFGGRLPEWPWWGYATAPLVIGLAQLGIDRYLRPSQKSRGRLAAIPQWKKGVFLVFLVIGGLALVVLFGWMFEH